jgi:hypothetical protein
MPGASGARSHLASVSQVLKQLSGVPVLPAEAKSESRTGASKPSKR